MPGVGDFGNYIWEVNKSTYTVVNYNILTLIKFKGRYPDNLMQKIGRENIKHRAKDNT